MAAFLSDEWFDALAAAAARATPPADAAVAVGHVVRRRDGEVAWTLVLRDGRATVERGTVEGADVVLHDDEETAAAIHRGELTAQEAVARGRLKVSGDVRRLVAATAALATLDGAFAKLRADTTD
jgi:hypothetical protein